MTSLLTVRQVAARIVELGLVASSTVEQELEQDELDENLDEYGDSDSEAVLNLLDTLGIRYTTDYETFRDACEDGGEVYREELERVAACARGLLSITDVELVDGTGGDHVLRFRCNGQLHDWKIAHDDEGTWAQMAFIDGLDYLYPIDSSARWCGVDSDDLDYGTQAVFGDPEALRLLGAEFGISFYLPE